MDLSLTDKQRELLKNFYSFPFTKAILSKSETNALWSYYIANKNLPPNLNLEKKVPALYEEIQKAIRTGNNIQSAVFSECVYAQTLANMMGLSKFVSSLELLPETVLDKLVLTKMKPRYAYTNGTLYLIQAGGHGAVDMALISLQDGSIYHLESKEPGAKTGEPDLPKYGEDGLIVISDDFLRRNPHFREMLNEQRDLNFFKHMGSNINNFSKDAIMSAVDSSYSESTKLADVVCTVDKDNYLVMMPANAMSAWATTIEGEIRPAGRNPYSVWTPNALMRFVAESGGQIDGDRVTMPLNSMIPTKERGSDRIGRYKINSLFFVRPENITFNPTSVSFMIKDVRQLNPTISAKVFFSGLSITSLHEAYSKL